MAQSDALDRVIAEDGPASKRLVVRLSHYEESQLLDIRYWYQDKKTSEYRPTGKGVSLTRRNFQFLKDIIERKTEQILDWLSISYVPEEVAAYEARQAQTNADLDLATPSSQVALVREPRDAEFFYVSRNGAAAVVSLNEAHPFVADLLQAIGAGDEAEAKALVGRLLVCHAQAEQTLADAPATHAGVLFDQLRFNWSGLLRRSSSWT
jgi:hypothetical protein